LRFAHDPADPLRKALDHDTVANISPGLKNNFVRQNRTLLRSRRLNAPQTRSALMA
jgi:hypothetical protein